MKKIISAIALLFCIVTLSSSKSYAQASSDNYSKIPVWIQMMDNPEVNFYEAVKAYNEYWKSHEKPTELEEETMNNEEQMKEYKREHKRENKNAVLSDKEKKELQEKEQMIYQCKRFENWVLTVKPFVQEDGRILSQVEIDAIWQKQQQEILNQNK